MTTQHTDPYSSPRSDVGDVISTEYGEVKIFSFSGRIGRLRYMAYSMGLMLMLALGGGLIGVLTAPTLSNQGGDLVSGAVGLIMLVVYAFTIVASFALAVRRLNDFDTSGWMSLLLFVPVVNAVLGIALWLIPGTQGKNRYGAPPPHNSGGVTFLALLLPIVMVIGILAAVAIPAYQDYAQRAAEMQVQ